MMIATERLLLTGDKKRLVREGNPEGKTLYCTPGTEIPDSAVALFGLVDGTIGEGSKGSGDKGGTKERKPGQDKEKAPDGDKGAGGGTKDATATADASIGDDLTKIKFVGPAVAAGLAKAGFTTIAAVAVIDPANAPAVDGTGARTNWVGMVESANELVAAAVSEQEQGGGDASGDAGAGAGAADQQAN